MTRIFTVTLTGSQEVPSNNSQASGSGVVIWDEAAGTAAYHVTVTGLDFGRAAGTAAQTPSTRDDVTSIHFHNQNRGANGGVVFGQVGPAQDADDLRITSNGDGSWTIQGVWEPTDPANVPIGNFAAVLNRASEGQDVPLYLNIHTMAFPGGEIRGQLVMAGRVEGSVDLWG